MIFCSLFRFLSFLRPCALVFSICFPAEQPRSFRRSSFKRARGKKCWRFCRKLLLIFENGKVCLQGSNFYQGIDCVLNFFPAAPFSYELLANFQLPSSDACSKWASKWWSDAETPCDAYFIRSLPRCGRCLKTKTPIFHFSILLLVIFVFARAARKLFYTIIGFDAKQ